MKAVMLMSTALLLASHASAQDKPDFSGRWTIVQDSAAGRGGARGGGGRAAAGDMGSGWGSNLTITQNASRLTVEYMFFTRGDMQPPLRFAYALDGTETKNSVMMGRGIQVQTSKTAWDGARLIITTQHPFTNPQTGQAMTSEVKQIVSLESPTSMLVETQRAAQLGGPASSTKSTYRKN